MEGLAGRGLIGGSFVVLIVVGGFVVVVVVEAVVVVVVVGVFVAIVSTRSIGSKICLHSIKQIIKLSKNI